MSVGFGMRDQLVKVGLIRMWVCRGVRVNSLFWMDICIGEVPLCERLSRLYQLSELKRELVASTFVLGQGVELEELVEKCRMLLLDVSLLDDIRDEWRWVLSEGSSYTISDVYQLLTTRDHYQKYSIFLRFFLLFFVPAKTFVYNIFVRKFCRNIRW